MPLEPLTDRSLAAWVEATTNFRLEAWQQQICARLERLRHETGQRVMIHKPPQFGGSIIVSQRAPAWWIGQDPNLRVKLACYNQFHARSFSRINLQLLQGADAAQWFPETDSRVIGEPCSVDGWFTAARWRRQDGQPSFMPMGIGSAFVGQGADILLVDDPYKNREEAFSAVMRENVWQWWQRVAKVRMGEFGNVVVMFHRWHLDDLAGRLLGEGGWEIMTFPALADGNPHDPTGRALGESLSPRFSVPFLEKLRDEDPTGFAALFQGQPVADGGNLIKRDWWGRWGYGERSEDYPRYAQCPGKFDEICIFGDTASSQKQKADYTVLLVIGRKGSRCFVLDMARGQWQTTEVIAQLQRLAAKWPAAIYKLLEADHTGDVIKNLLQDTMAGIDTVRAQTLGDMTVRVNAVEPVIRAGNVYLPAREIHEWSETIMVEAGAFPAGAHDDIVSALTLGLIQRFMHPMLGAREAEKKAEPAGLAAFRDLLKQ